MTTKEHKLDRTGWEAGPWDGEPDRMEWRDEATGLPCLIVRGQVGALCGYVGVPPSHPWHGVEYDAIDADVHGGLTYASKCHGTICHVPAPGESDDVWWLGFDCAHAGDIVPGSTRWSLPFRGDVYRDVAYVRGEVARLAAQAGTGVPKGE